MLEKAIRIKVILFKLWCIKIQAFKRNEGPMLPNQVLLASAAAPADAPRLGGEGSFFCLETEAEESMTQALLKRPQHGDVGT